MIKAVCTGRAQYDMSIVVDEYPKEGSKRDYIGKIGCGGGIAANFACLLAKWGIQTTFVGVVGNDVYGQKFKKELDQLRIDTRFLETNYEIDTPLMLSFITKNNGKSTTMDVMNDYAFAKKYDLDFTPDMIMTDGLDINASKTLLSQYPKAVSFLDADLMNTNTLDLCKRVNFILCSKRFAEAASGQVIDMENTQTLVEAFNRLKNKYIKQQIVITLGEAGAVYCINNQVKISPTLKVTPVDITGAGDIFRAAFAYQIASGGDIEKAVKYGNIAAGLSMKIIGCRRSIPSVEEVNKLYEQKY